MSDVPTLDLLATVEMQNRLVAKQQSEIAELVDGLKLLKERTRNNPELWDTDGIVMIIERLLKGE